METRFAAYSLLLLILALLVGLVLVVLAAGVGRNLRNRSRDAHRRPPRPHPDGEEGDEQVPFPRHPGGSPRDDAD